LGNRESDQIATLSALQLRRACIIEQITVDLLTSQRAFANLALTLLTVRHGLCLLHCHILCQSNLSSLYSKQQQAHQGPNWVSTPRPAPTCVRGDLRDTPNNSLQLFIASMLVLVMRDARYASGFLPTAKKSIFAEMPVY